MDKMFATSAGDSRGGNVTFSSFGQPTQVGDFVLGQEIGRGSFATVYKGHHTVQLSDGILASVLRLRLPCRMVDN